MCFAYAVFFRFQYGNPKTHEWFQQWEDKGDYTMRFFIEPVVLAVNYAEALGYDEIVMLGLSGGGWTTTVSAAVDSRIKLSIPVAGSVRANMRYGIEGTKLRVVVTMCRKF